LPGYAFQGAEDVEQEDIRGCLRAELDLGASSSRVLAGKEESNQFREIGLDDVLALQAVSARTETEEPMGSTSARTTEGISWQRVLLRKLSTWASVAFLASSFSAHATTSWQPIPGELENRRSGKKAHRHK